MVILVNIYCVLTIDWQKFPMSEYHSELMAKAKAINPERAEICAEMGYEGLEKQSLACFYNIIERSVP